MCFIYFGHDLNYKIAILYFWDMRVIHLIILYKGIDTYVELLPILKKLIWIYIRLKYCLS